MRLSRSALPVLLLAAACARATQHLDEPIPPAPAAAQPTPEVGSKAPNFMFTAVTKDGIQKPAKLSDHRGETVVLWFFIKARTRG